MRRNEKNMPENEGSAGIMLKRNPGVTLLWATRSYKPFKAGRGVLFEVGPPQRVEFYAEGRKATHDEIMASIDSGMPILREMAEQDGPEAVAELEEMYANAMQLVPA
jgi:hypothetical protein